MTYGMVNFVHDIFIHTEQLTIYVLTKATAVAFESSLTVNTAKNDKLMVM